RWLHRTLAHTARTWCRGAKRTSAREAREHFVDVIGSVQNTGELARQPPGAARSFASALIRSRSAGGSRAQRTPWMAPASARREWVQSRSGAIVWSRSQAAR